MINKLTLLTLLVFSPLFAKEYMTQIKPYESYTIKAQNSGLVQWVNTTKEASYIKNKTLIVKLDTKEENIDLKAQEELLLWQKEIVNIKEKNYRAKKSIKQLSQYDKNNEKLSYLEAKKEKIQTQKNILTLQNAIENKHFFAQHQYVGTIHVKQGEYVNIGDDVLNLYDISKLKIILFLTQNEINDSAKQTLYVNDVATEFKLHKSYQVKDDIKVSRYKVEFIQENKASEHYFFDDVVKVELR